MTNRIAVAAALGLAATLAVAAPPAAPAPATTAGAFADSIGVNVHANADYEANHDAITRKLGELGVRHVRDGAYPLACQYALEFHAKFGIKTTFIAGRRVGGRDEWKSPLDRARIPAELADLRAALVAAAAVEGPNEYDLFHDGREPDWPGALRAYQAELHAALKADPILKSLPVIAPSLTSEGAYKSVGDLDALADFPCLHLYQSSRHPGTGGWGDGGYGSITWALDRLAKRQSPAGRPVTCTEAGYQLAGADAVPEAVDAAYTLRMFAEFSRRGIARTFKYELLGDQWGLLRDDLSERPAFAALKNLLAVLRGEGGVRPARREFAATVAGPPDARHLLLSRADGATVVLVWREVPLFDPSAKKELAAAPAEVVLSCPKPARRARVYDPGAGADPTSDAPGTGRLALPVAGRLLAVVFDPS